VSRRIFSRPCGTEFGNGVPTHALYPLRFFCQASFGCGEKNPALLRIVSGEQFVQDALSRVCENRKEPADSEDNDQVKTQVPGYESRTSGAKARPILNHLRPD
jgi:hypothetical protein